jgi:hypothetical protein
VPVGVSLAAGLLALGAGSVYFVSDSGVEKPRDEKGAEKEPARAVESGVGPAASAQPAASPLPVPAAAPPEAESPAPAPADDSTVDNAEAAAAPTAPPSGPSEVPAPPTSAVTAPVSASAQREATFVRSAPLPSGAEIRLGGIAWSETAPLAYLNGKLLGVGESTAGARVERIERDRVVLTGPEGRIVITLR